MCWVAGNILWLASYPKSGNTWMRVLLANYLGDLQSPVHINELELAPVASGRSLFDDLAGSESSDMTPKEIERYRPRVYKELSDRADELVYLKVHDAFTRTAEGVPLLSKSATYGAVYLIRNPLDVSVSLAHHTGWPVDEVIRQMANEKFSFDGNLDCLRRQLKQKLLTWSGHVSSWVDEPDVKVLVVRYEDMVADTERQLARVASFCGLQIDQPRIEQAVAFSRFDALQAQERADGFREKEPFSTSFFREGRIGTWRDSLTDSQRMKILHDHSAIMERFGYAPFSWLHESPA